MKNTKKNTKIVASFIVLVVVMLGIGIYITYDKGVNFSNVEKEEKNASTTKVIKKTSTTQNSDSKEMSLDLSKCLNNKEYSYRNATDVEWNAGLSMKVNPDKKSVTLTIDWAQFGPLSGSSIWNNDIISYQIVGFSKEVSDVFIGEVGQDSMGLTLFYIMNDQTVEYTPLFNLKTDSQNNTYHEMNYTYERSTDGRVVDTYFTSNGRVGGANGVIKLYNVDAVYGISSARTTIGATKDGSFYDLGDIINK